MTIDIIHTKVDFQRHLNGCERRLHDLTKNLQTIEKLSRNLSVNNAQLYFKQLAEIASDIKFLYSSILQLDQCPYSVTAIKRLSSLKICLQKSRMKFEAMQQDAHNNLGYDYKQNDIEKMNDEQQEQLAKLINGNDNETTLELNRIEKHTTFVGGLEKDLVDIHEAFHDMHRIVYEQGRMVSNIEDALTSTDDRKQPMITDTELMLTVNFLNAMAFTLIIVYHYINASNKKAKLDSQPGTYAIIYRVHFIIWTGIIPNGLTLSFSFSTFRNVVKTKQRVGATTTRMTTEQRRTQKAESQLIGASLNWL
ncbi:unnamed protein product [Rotaria socialis]|uniref:t-SNARE coiled-coil homology domain-containing protein n=1 Tax=Rotaria socialis TaxID=392032 RepID=A0A820YIB0_9BILA|nr:unnamed protein product [Rotaria socialis]